MQPFRLTLVLLAFGGMQFACRTETPPQPYVRSIHLEALDVSCTEAWLKVTLTDSNEPRTVALRRDDSITVVSGLRLLRSDTLIVDEGLLPNRSYTYRAYRVSDSRLTDSSAEATVTTMDTSRSNFTFQIDTLGDGGGSVLYDVAIINDTLAYAVGEIYKRDSVGNWDPNAYNLVKWNGHGWELRRLYTYSSCNPVDYAPLKAIWAFSETNILVTSGGSLGRYNGTTNTPDCSIRPLVTGSINKIWASSENDIYVVGNNGFIAHYDGTGWRRLESGTTLPIVDILGVRDANGGYEILAVADGYDRPEGSYVLSIKNNTVHQVWHDPRPYGLDEVWFVPGRQYIVVGSGVWRSYSAGTGSSWTMVGGLPAIHSTCIRGQALNDFFVGGAFWNLLHFNGLAWQAYFPFASGSFTSVAIKDNLIVAVGGASGRAIAVRGTR